MENFEGYIIGIILLCPSLIRLIWVSVAVKYTEIFDTSSSGFKSGLLLSILGSMISPGVPAYYIWKL